MDVIDLLSSSPSPPNSPRQSKYGRESTGKASSRRVELPDATNHADFVDLSRDSQQSNANLKSKTKVTGPSPSQKRDLEVDFDDHGEAIRYADISSDSDSGSIFVRSGDAPGSSPEKPVARYGGAISEYEDPFASPPPLLRGPKASLRAKRAWEEEEEEEAEEDPFDTLPESRHVAKGKGNGISERVGCNPFLDSSPVPAISLNKGKGKSESVGNVVIDISDWDSSPPASPITPEDLASSDDEFPDIEDLNFSLKLKKLRRQATASTSTTTTKRAAQKTTRPRPRTKCEGEPKSAARNEAKAATKKLTVDDREASKQRKAAEKEQKERDMQEAKRQRASEKEKAAALAEVNKLRVDKKTSTPEMIVDLPSTLNAALILQIATLLSALDVEHHVWDSPVPKVVRWRRKVCSSYNEDLGHWEPAPARIEKESHVMAILSAEEFVELALSSPNRGGGGTAGLEGHVATMRHRFPGDKLVYMIEGLTTWMRRNKNVRNKAYASRVRGEGENTAPPGSQQRQQQKHISEDTVEDALLALQINYGTLVHQTTSQLDTAQWTVAFTQHLSTAPYRHRAAAAVAGVGFCMDGRAGMAGSSGAGGVSVAGETPRNALASMLTELARVTAPIAYGVADEFGSASNLAKRLKALADAAGGGNAGHAAAAETLAKCRRSNGIGAGPGQVGVAASRSDQIIGPAVAKRVVEVFLGIDETSADV